MKDRGRLWPPKVVTGVLHEGPDSVQTRKHPGRTVT